MRLICTVNGEARQTDDVWAGESLLYVLRERLGLPGAKNACEQGECGSCTVYLDGLAVCACLVAAGQAEGAAVVTVEGLRPPGDGSATGDDALDRVQRAFLDAGAVQCGFCTPGLVVAVHDLLAREPQPADPDIREALAGNLCRCTGYEKIMDAVRLAAGETGVILIDNCTVACVDAAGTEYGDGHVVVGDDGRIQAVGTGHAGRYHRSMRRIDGTGCLLTPGLVNTHHHLYQWATRGLALDETLFGWLQALYPIWGRLDAETVSAAAGAGLGWLALSGCTTSMDHHYVFPRDGGDVLAAEIEAARHIGLRFHPTRGSMDLGESSGGLPPDNVVEDTDVALAATEAAIDAYHDPSPDSMLQVAVAPCSPFSVTSKLMSEAAVLARRRGVRLHTHLAETDDEESFCAERFGCTPVEYAESLGWLGDDVWLAHGVHLDDAAVARLGATGTGVAHCPSSNARLGAGTARVRDLLDAGAPVGLGVDGAASQEVSHLGAELRQALYAARLRGGPGALTAREALRLGTMGGARCLGRHDDIGSIEVGKLADVVLWRLDGLGHDGIDDRVAALVFGPPAPVELALVGGDPVVERGELVHADAEALARRARRAHRRLMKAAR